MVKEMALNTSVSAGTLDAFSNAFARSVLGVTFKKYKKRGKPFYDNRKHNEEITKKAFEYLYFRLREEQKTLLTDYDVRVNYTLVWDDDGKILYFKDIVLNCYLKVCDMSIDKLELTHNIDEINMHIFYSENDRGSKEMLSQLDSVIIEYNNIQINKIMHCFTDEDYSENSKIHSVEYFPTIVIDDIKLEKFTHSDITNLLDKYLDKRIIPPKIEVKNHRLMNEIIKKIE